MGATLKTPSLAVILNACADPIFVKDEEHRWILINDAFCRFMGYPREQLLGKSDWEFFPREQAQVFWDKDQLVFSTGIENENEESFTDADGTLHIIATKKSIFHDENGRKLLVGIIRDITQQKMLQRELIAAREAALEAARTKSAFLANMSHEIRTPMNGVIGMTQILLGSELSEEQRELATIIKKSGEHLLSIINDILDFSKIEAGKVRLEQIDFNVRETIEQVIDLVAARAMEKDIELACFVDPKIPAVLSGDPARITEVLLNLLGNALKFTERGAVVLRASLAELNDERARVLLSVEDSGIGIAAEDLGGLFQAFFQVDSSATRRYGGTGLGLAISRQLVEMMGGKIEVESSPGKGSTFLFTISLGRGIGPGPMPPAIPAGLLGESALVVDHHPFERGVIVDQLTAYGMNVVAASDAPEAIRALLGTQFSLLLVDGKLPDLQRVLLATANLRHRPFVALLTVFGAERPPSSLDDAALKIVGASKPIVESRLIHALSTLVEPQPAQVAVTPVRPPPVAEGRSRHVLVVEDNPINQRVAKSLLETLGYAVTLAGDGKEALRAMDRESFSIILMDCQMPVMDGFTATREIRKLSDARAKIPIIAMSASALPEDRERALNAGMDDYLSKPVQLDGLRKMLDVWITSSASSEPADA